VSGDADVNNNGRPLLQLYCNNALCIMNTFFQHRDVHKYNYCRDYLVQQSLTDLCIVSADSFRSVLDIRVKRHVELLTDHHLLVCNLHLLKLQGHTQTCRARKSY